MKANSASTQTAVSRVVSLYNGLDLGGLGLLPTLLARVLLPPQDSQGWYPDAPQKYEN